MTIKKHLESRSTVDVTVYGKEYIIHQSQIPRPSYGKFVLTCKRTGIVMYRSLNFYYFKNQIKRFFRIELNDSLLLKAKKNEIPNL